MCSLHFITKHYIFRDMHAEAKNCGIGPKMTKKKSFFVMQSYAVCHSTGNVCSGYLWRLSLIQSLQPRDYKAIDAMLGCLKWCSCYALACETSYFLTLQLYHEFKIYDRCNYFRELPTIFELLWKSCPVWSRSGPPLQQQCFNKSIIVFSTWNSSCPFELTEVWKP